MAESIHHRLISYLPDGRVIIVRVVVSDNAVIIRGVGINGEAAEFTTLPALPAGLGEMPERPR